MSLSGRRRRRDRPRLCEPSSRQARFTHIDPPTSSNAIMQRAEPLLRREQWIRQAHHGELDSDPRVREQPGSKPVQLGLADLRPLLGKADISCDKADDVTWLPRLWRQRVVRSREQSIKPRSHFDSTRRSADHRVWRPPKGIDPRASATWPSRAWTFGCGVTAALRTARGPWTP